MMVCDKTFFNTVEKGNVSRPVVIRYKLFVIVREWTEFTLRKKGRSYDQLVAIKFLER